MTAQEHLRILSGLYGILAPTDTIQPYRLEMGTKLKDFPSGAKTLYEFWGDKIARSLMDDLREQGGDDACIVNLCSNEYFKAVDVKSIGNDIKVYECVFKDNNKVVSVYAKRARGLMARHLLERVDALTKGKTRGSLSSAHVETMLKDFNSEGYSYDLKSSTKSKFVFARFGKFQLPLSEEEDDEGMEERKGGKLGAKGETADPVDTLGENDAQLKKKSKLRK